MRFAEVEREAKFPVGKASVSQYLLGVHRRKRGDRLQFYDHNATDQKIGAITFFKQNAIVSDRHWFLPFDPDACFSQFMSENHFIDRFKKSRPKFRVHKESSIENLLR